MQEFNVVKSADAQVQHDIANWENKADDYVNEFFDREIERIYGTRFGENLAIISDIAENATVEPKTFRGVRDLAGRLQAAAIVHQRSNYLEVDLIATAPWNIWQNQPQSIKGAGTALMEELVKERLRVVKRDEDLVLVGISDRDRKADPIEIGRTYGITSGFAKIVLNPGWQFTKRTFKGKVLGHIYLSSQENPVDGIAAQGLVDKR